MNVDESKRYADTIIKQMFEDQGSHNLRVTPHDIASYVLGTDLDKEEQIFLSGILAGYVTIFIENDVFCEKLKMHDDIKVNKIDLPANSEYIYNLSLMILSEKASSLEDVSKALMQYDIQQSDRCLVMASIAAAQHM